MVIMMVDMEVNEEADNGMNKEVDMQRGHKMFLIFFKFKPSNQNQHFLG